MNLNNAITYYIISVAMETDDVELDADDIRK